MLDTMKNQQILVDSKLAQLRTEHHELYAAWSDITFMTGEDGEAGIDGPAPGVMDITRPNTANTTATANSAVSDTNGEFVFANKMCLCCLVLGYIYRQLLTEVICDTLWQ